MKETTNYHLKKPEETDFYDVEDFNYNADLIDEKLSNLATNTTLIQNSRRRLCRRQWRKGSRQQQ